MSAESAIFSIHLYESVTYTCTFLIATSTSSDRLRILLVIEKPFYEAGDWLEGAVVLELYDRRAVRRVMLSLIC